MIYKVDLDASWHKLLSYETLEETHRMVCIVKNGFVHAFLEDGCKIQGTEWV